MQLKSTIYNYYNKLLNAYGTQFIKPSISKLDKNKVTELMISDLSQKILERIKNDLEQIYLKDRELEKTLKPHSIQHHQTVQRMHETAANLAIVKEEIALNKSNFYASFAKIASDLKLTNYTPKNDG